MIRAILFDLDDTLLGNHLDTFLPRYFGLLGKYAAELMPREQFIQALLACTELTIKNMDQSLTNYEVFWQAFTAQTGLDGGEMELFFDRFYQELFPQLREVTRVRPSTRPLIQSCFDAGLAVVIATNPLFPRSAIEQRLAWAGVPVNEFDYALVTTMENMHTTKPHTSYYSEILEHIGCSPEAALMVGDNWQNDIVPTAALGMHTFWIPTTAEPAPDASLLTGWGTLDDLHERVRAGWLERIVSSEQ
jgi:FMN phosphatase YigB (HAD superfamily)